METKNLISRKEAKEQGLKYYFTGKPCPKNHIDERFTSNCACVQCSKDRLARDSQTEHFKKKQAEWYLKNRDYRVLRHKQWYHDNKEKCSEKAKIYREQNLEKVRDISRRSYYKNKDHSSKQAKEYRDRNKEKISERSKRYNLLNKDRVRLKRKEYYENNKAAHFAYAKLRYCLKISRVPSWANKERIKEIYEEARLLTDATGIQYHVDHIIPLQGKTVCGLHVENNLRVVPAFENLSKNNRLIPELVNHA